MQPIKLVILLGIEKLSFEKPTYYRCNNILKFCYNSLQICVGYLSSGPWLATN